jgi:hypothetical protein
MTIMRKITDTLAKELESLSAEGLREFFMYFYRMNHYQANMIAPDKFEEFLESFESNPFKINEDEKFKKQLIDSIIKYAFDHMSLITAAVLIKKKFTIEEIMQNYYTSIDVFNNEWF